jgi:hypothetical protein
MDDLSNAPAGWRTTISSFPTAGSIAVPCAKITRSTACLLTKTTVDRHGPINEADLFLLDIAEGCVMNKLIQPQNLAYLPTGETRLQNCMLLAQGGAATGIIASDWIENGDKFIGLVQKCVEADGTVRRGKKSTKSITIKRFHIIDGF